MAEVVRVVLLIALAAALLTTLALALSWWMEPPRRIRRAQSGEEFCPPLVGPAFGAPVPPVAAKAARAPA